MQTESAKDIKQAFSVYLRESAMKYLSVKLILAVLVIAFFAYADIVILNSIGNFYSRILPFGIAVILLVFHLFTKQKFKRFKIILLNALLVTSFIMMYSICIVHLNKNTLSAAVTATTVVIFIISLEIKASTTITALIYFIPTVLLFLILTIFYNLPGKQHLILSNIYAFVIFGFVLNRIQNSLRYKAFESKYLLNIEKQKTENHYQDALKLNAELSRSHKEITFQRDEIEKKNKELQNKNEEIVSQAREIELANKKLKELNLFKEEMTGMIVHDLKNPLNSIIGLAKSDAVKQAGKQMLNMVMNILDVQKYENAEIVLDTAIYSLNGLAESAVRQVDALLKQKSIHLKNHIADDAVEADWELIERVFVNIMTNAIKYTPNNGSITLNASGALPGRQNKNGHFLKVTITDTGQGIPAHKIDSVFQKFEQVVAKKSGMARSTGIGLTFCKLIIEAHGGHIGVESEVGKGTGIWFTLPAASQKLKDFSRKKQNQYEFNVELSESEKLMLQAFVPKFRRLNIYEYSRMEAILRDPVFSKTENLRNWKEAMNNALLGSNEEKLTELIKMIGTKTQQ